MALPAGITPKTVTIGIASFFDGTLTSGRVTITAPVNVVHTPTNRPIFSSEMTQKFTDGAASFSLCPTDAPGLNRVDWTYKLKVQVDGASVQPEVIYFTLPAAGPDEVDLDALVTVPSSAGTPVSVNALTVPGGGTPGQPLVYTGTGSGVGWGVPYATAAGLAGPGIYLPAGWGANWAAAKTNAGTTLARVAFAGDSIGRGYFSSNLDTKGFAGLLRAALQTKYGDGGTGFKGMIDSTVGGISSPTPYLSQFWSFTGSWSAGAAKEGPGGVVAQAGSSATATHAFTGTTIEIFTLRDTSSAVTPDWSYQIDGGTAVPVTGNGTVGINKVVASGLSAGSHTLKVIAPPSGNIYLCGARSYNATGVVVDNYSRQGGTSDLFNNTGSTYGAAGRWSGGDLQRADLVIYAMLANDAGATSETTFFQNLANYLESVRGSAQGTSYTATNGAPDLLIVMPHIGKFKSIANTVPLVYRARSMAEQYGAAFVNFNPIGRNSWDWMNNLGYWSDGASASGLAGTDTVHPSDAGHQWMYNQLIAGVPGLV